MLALTIPLETDGRIDGTVMAEVLPVTPPRGGGTATVGWLITAATLAIFLLMGRWLRGGPSRILTAAVLLIVAVLIYDRLGVDRLVSARLAVERTVAEEGFRLVDNADRALRQVTGDMVPALAFTDWDLDPYRQPYRLHDAAGIVDTDAATARFATSRGRFVQGVIALGLLGLVLGGWVATGWARRTWDALVGHRQAYGFVAPAMFGMILLVFFPFVYGVVLSFTEQTILNLNKPLYEVWIGLENYVNILTDFDFVQTTELGRSVDYTNFYWTLGFTIVWTVSNVAIGVTVGLILALILNTPGLKFRAIYRVILILPWAVPNYITALIWRGMFHQQFGVINQIIQIFGGQPIAWFDRPLTSFVAVLATNGWLSFPFMMVVSLGALQSIPADLYEAARVDGATKWQQFRLITLPSLKPALVPAVILSVVWTFNMFNIIYLVSAGEPAGATEILITDAYKIAFEQYRYGYAAAYSVVIFLVLFVYGIWQNHATKATEGI